MTILDEADYPLPIWAGVLPLNIRAGTAIPDPRLGRGIDAPSYVSSIQERRILSAFAS
ncbi:MAG TPA: hypothetical protein VIK50_06960 [Gemmatimonadaceae bacterium]